MIKKKILVLDRDYSLKYMKSELFDVYVVALNSDNVQSHKNKGLNVIGCFEDEYDSLPVAEYEPDYLTHSFDCDRFLCRFPLEKRKKILGKEISFWNKIFDTYQPDLIVNELVTIEFMEVMYIEAKKRNIPYHTWCFVPFAPKDIWVTEPPYNTRMIPGFWDSVSTTQDDVKIAQNYITSTREKGHKPFYIDINNGTGFHKLIIATKFYLKAQIENIRRSQSGTFIYEDYVRQAKLDYEYAWSYMFGKYDSLEYNDDNEYFFYPLHLEPESAVEYSGFFFNDQRMLIGRIAHSLKTNQILIVKEHPQQEGVLLTKKYQDLKRKYPNLIFVRGRYSSYNIYPKIKCLITLNGTAGFESWVCKRPVIVFGEVFYKDFPGITSCDSFKQLYDILRNNKFQQPQDCDIVSYVSKIVHLLTDTFPYNWDGEIKEEHVRQLTEQFEGILSR